MPNITPNGAKAVTADLDRLADLFETEASTLGVPSNIASDFAYRADLLSDAIERNAGLRPQASEDKKDDAEDKKDDADVAEDDADVAEDDEESKKASLAELLRVASDVEEKMAAREKLPVLTLDALPGLSPQALTSAIDRITKLRQESQVLQKQYEVALKKIASLGKEEKQGLALLKKAGLAMNGKQKVLVETETSLLTFQSITKSFSPGVVQMLADPADSKFGDKAGDFFGRVGKQLGAEVQAAIEGIYTQTKISLTHEQQVVSLLKVAIKTASADSATLRQAAIADVVVSIQDWLAGGFDGMIKRVFGIARSLEKWVAAFGVRAKMVKKDGDTVQKNLAQAGKLLESLISAGRVASEDKEDDAKEDDAKEEKTAGHGYNLFG